MVLTPKSKAAPVSGSFEIYKGDGAPIPTKHNMTLTGQRRTEVVNLKAGNLSQESRGVT